MSSNRERIFILKSKCIISFISFKSTSLSITFPLQYFHGWSICLIECLALCHVCSIIWRSIEGLNETLTIWPGLLIPCFSSFSNALSIVPMSLNLSKDSQPQVCKFHYSNNKLKTVKYTSKTVKYTSGFLLLWFLLRPIRT